MLTPRMRDAVRAPRGRGPDRGDGSPFAGRYLIHANNRTVQALKRAGLVERIFTGARPDHDAYALTAAGEELRQQLRAQESTR